MATAPEAMHVAKGPAKRKTQFSSKHADTVKRALMGDKAKEKQALDQAKKLAETFELPPGPSLGLISRSYWDDRSNYRRSWSPSPRRRAQRSVSPRRHERSPSPPARIVARRRFESRSSSPSRRMKEMSSPRNGNVKREGSASRDHSETVEERPRRKYEDSPPLQQKLEREKSANERSDMTESD